MARVAELLYFPLAGLTLLALPVPRLDRPGEVLATGIIAVETVLAVAVYVNLGRRRRWAAGLAIVLAAWVLVGVATRGPALASAAAATGSPALLGSLALLAWVALTQLTVLAACLSDRLWRDELR
ncbi:MAG TPA: hypothetical protein VGO40_08885 [Longimicrobium sp.]|nr:hypothetical protein [Longimicrobium sp.]